MDKMKIGRDVLFVDPDHGFRQGLIAAMHADLLAEIEEMSSLDGVLHEVGTNKCLKVVILPAVPEALDLLRIIRQRGLDLRVVLSLDVDTTPEESLRLQEAGASYLYTKGHGLDGLMTFLAAHLPAPRLST